MMASGVRVLIFVMIDRLLFKFYYHDSLDSLKIMSRDCRVQNVQCTHITPMAYLIFHDHMLMVTK